MIQIPSDFNSAKPYDGSSSAPLPVGGHACRINGAKLETARTGTPMLVVAFDISEGGEYDDYYRARYERAIQFRTDAKWPGVFRAPITTREGKTSGYFKGLITAIEESNAGFKFSGDENALKNKMVGFNFGEEEYKGNDGEIRTSVKPFYAVSVGRVREGIDPPQKKLYKPTQSEMMASRGFTEVEDDTPLPF
jgi:hypothetical protein